MIEKRHSTMLMVIWFCLPATVLLLVWAHLGNFLSALFLPLMMVLGFIFLKYSQEHFVRFVIILFFFSPFVRRLADYGSDYHENSLILLAPYAVVFLTIGYSFTHRRLLTKSLLPMYLAGFAVVYGTAVGMINVHEVSVAKSFIRWMTPLLLCAYLAVQEHKHELTRTLLKTISWGAVVVGGYGIVQYALAPQWDALWLQHAREAGATSFGIPEPFGIRVFSTLSSPAQCASVLCMGLLASFILQKWSRTLLYVMALSGLALTAARSAWLAVLPLLAYCFMRLPRREKITIGAALMLLLGSVTFIKVPSSAQDASTAVGGRIATLQSIQGDESYEVRKQGIARAIHLAEENPFGMGIGFIEGKVFEQSTMATLPGFGPHDVGALEYPLELGYLGTILYGVALLLQGRILLRTLIGSTRAQALVAACGLLGWLILATGNPMIAIEGVLFWSAAGLIDQASSERWPSSWAGHFEPI